MTKTTSPFVRLRREIKPILAAVAVSVMAVAGTWFGGTLYSAQILQNESIEEGRNWTIYLSRNLPRILTIIGTTKPQENERRIIESARRAAGITHFRFLAPNGKIIYSSTLKEIGQTVSDPVFAASIAEVSDGSDISESVNASGGTVYFRTAFIPVLDETDRIAGAIQVMSDATDRYGELQLVTLFTTAGLATVLLGILVLMVVATKKAVPPVALIRPNVTPEPAPRPDNAAVSQAISRALALVRHELRTPLAGISAMSDQLRQPGATEAFPALSGALHRNSNALLDLIDTITSPAPEAPDSEPQAFNLKEAVADAIDLLAQPAEARGLQLIDVVEETLPMGIMGNRRMLTQLLVSMLNHGMEMVRDGNLLIAVRGGNVPGTYDAVEFELSFSGAASPKADPGNDRSVLRRLVTRLGGELLPDSSGGDLPHFVLPLPGAIGNLPEEAAEMPPPHPTVEEPAPPSFADEPEMPSYEHPAAMEPAQPPFADEPEMPSYEHPAAMEPAQPPFTDEPEMPSYEHPAAMEPAAMEPVDNAGAPRSQAKTLDLSTLTTLREGQDGRPGLIERVIGNYLEQSPVSLKKLADGVQRGNAPLVQMAANRLKTSSSNIGAERLTELCDAMEGLARSGQLDTAEPLLSEIVTELANVEAVLDMELPPDDASQASV